jgi:hypothetical protein
MTQSKDEVQLAHAKVRQRRDRADRTARLIGNLIATTVSEERLNGRVEPPRIPLWRGEL